MKVVIKMGDRYLGVDPTPIPGKVDDARFPVYSDRGSAGEWEEAEVMEHDGGRFDVRFIASNRQLSVTPYGVESRTAGSFGVWELPYATNQPDGSSLLYRAHSNSIIGPVLTLEPRS